METFWKWRFFEDSDADVAATILLGVDAFWGDVF